MRSLAHIIACFGFVLFAILGATLTAGAQGEPPATRDVVAVAYFCDTTDCANEPDGAKNSLEGATITSYDAAGNLVDSCVTESAGSCSLTIPAAEDGTYTVEAPAGFETYTLVSSTPESTGEGGDGREWTFVPAVDPEPETRDVVAVVYSCETPDCSDPDGVKDIMAGATVTSFAADGIELDTCTVGESYPGGCDLVIPADDSGSYDVTAPQGYDTYVLLSEQPEVTGEGGHGREWTFVPAGAAVNVVACNDAECTDPVTMDGAVVASYDSTGAEIDSCTVDSAPDDFDGCTLVLPVSGGDVDITPAAGYENYVLVDEQPEVYEGPEGGLIYVWSFVPVEPDATATPVPTEAPDATTTPVSALPKTGTGTQASADNDLLILSLGSVALLGLAAVAIATPIRRA
jgi:hypothetical protein